MAYTPFKRSSVSYNKFSSWRDIPWSYLHTQVVEEQEITLATARAENKQKYDAYIEKKAQEKEALNPEAGSWEGNLSDEFPFRDLPKDVIFGIKRKASTKAVETFVTDKHLKEFALGFMPELVKHLSTFKLSNMASEAYDPKLLQTPEFDGYGRVVAAEGQIDAAAYYKQVFTDDTMMGVYEFLMQDTRGSYIDKQYTSPGRNYCALVPLIMYAYKLHKGVPYSHWNQNRAKGIVNAKLYEAMMFTPEQPYTHDELLTARSEGLLTKSGAKQGQIRNPVYTHKLFGATLFKGVPEYAQVMLSQIWCAHPDNRTKYMVLDPVNWDNIPAPLISSEVLTKASVEYAPQSVNTEQDMPWD